MTSTVLKYPSTVLQSSTSYLNNTELVKLHFAPDTDVRFYTETSTKSDSSNYSIIVLAETSHTFNETTSGLTPGEVYSINTPEWSPGEHILRSDKSTIAYIFSSANYIPSVVSILEKQQYACEVGTHIVMLAGICTVQDTSTRLAFNKLYSIVRPGINIVSAMDSYILVIKPKPLET